MANKRVNELANASLPLVNTDSILVSRDGINVNKATINDLPKPLNTAQTTAGATGVVGTDSSGNLIGLDGLPISVGGASPSYDTAILSASTTAIRSAPTLIAGFVVSASASGVITLYANTANSGTVIWTGAVTAGQVVTFPTPYQSFIGVSFQLVSGTATIALSVK